MDETAPTGPAPAAEPRSADPDQGCATLDQIAAEAQLRLDRLLREWLAKVGPIDLPQMNVTINTLELASATKDCIVELGNGRKQPLAAGSGGSFNLRTRLNAELVRDGILVPAPVRRETGHGFLWREDRA
jgi:hypothetical protein